MDLEGYAKRALIKGDEDIYDRLVDRILEIKDISKDRAKILAQAVITESKATLDFNSPLLTFPESEITMGDFGVGSRGQGDFYAHKKIAQIIGKTSALVDSSQLDDSGVVSLDDGTHLIVTVDGMHSRLSDFPFLSGFHVTRAALRDIYVMGGIPIALLSDIHVADDGDVAKIFDHIAGISVVSEIMGVPLVTGSTLRIGGDMVIGSRMTGCVGAVGRADYITSRNKAKPGDVILMTEGAGGGTISTTALYYGKPEIVQETLNVKFLHACELLIKEGFSKKIHAMTDVTNGGVRGDAAEISKTAGVSLIFEEDKMRALVNPKVMAMLDELNIDYLGVSIDSLLIIARKEVAEEIKNLFSKNDILVDEVGCVKEGVESKIIIDKKEKDFSPRFRESAYTPLKKVVGETSEKDFSEMKNKIDEVALKSIKKKSDLINLIRGGSKQSSQQL